MKIEDLAQEVTMRFDKRAQIAEPQAQIYEAWSREIEWNLCIRASLLREKERLDRVGKGSRLSLKSLGSILNIGTR